MLTLGAHAQRGLLCLCVCLHFFSPDQAGSSAIPTALAQQGLESYVAILLKRRRSRDMASKRRQSHLPPRTATDSGSVEFYDGEARVLER